MKHAALKHLRAFMREPTFSVVVYRTKDRDRAQRSRFRYHSDGSDVYRLRLRGLLPLWAVKGGPRG